MDLEGSECLCGPISPKKTWEAGLHLDPATRFPSHTPGAAIVGSAQVQRSVPSGRNSAPWTGHRAAVFPEPLESS